uniref:Costars family protein ABRACL n=1 Tax=Laticauda laticaudata TaxID=8630 RepID=A0A8C5SLL4_LATLA
MNVEHEINLLVEEIRRLGTKNPDGTLSVKFGVLFADEKCANLFEALVGTLKAAKRRKIGEVRKRSGRTVLLFLRFQFLYKVHYLMMMPFWGMGVP